MTPSPDPSTPAIPDPLRNFTAAGRLWLACCMIVGVASLGALVAEVVPGLPTGSYPLVLFLLPVAGATVGMYFAGDWLLRKCGVRLRHSSEGRGTVEAGRNPPHGRSGG